MGKTRRSALSAQVSSTINQLAKKEGLFFRDTLDSGDLSSRVQKYFPNFRDRVFNPVTTLFAFLSQMLSPDKSCTETVARVNAERVGRDLEPISSDNSGYCKARERMPEEFIRGLAVDTGQEIEKNAPESWHWKCRRVKLVDGATITMADTPQNQAEYPQDMHQAEGIGFPMARLVGIFSLASGCIIDLVIGASHGKGTGESSLLRQLTHHFQPGEIVLGDAYFASYFFIAMLQSAGVDCVFAANASRLRDFRTGERLGKKDHRVFWKKSAIPRNGMSKEIYDKFPDSIQVRELVVTVERPGFRPVTLILVTTLLDPKFASKQDLGWLYGQRWYVELSLGAIKTTLKMDHIRGKTPIMVRKEIWTTLLAYNLIRKIICESAYRYDLIPWEISVKGTIQHLNAFGALWKHSNQNNKKSLDILLLLISKMRVANRPGRIEPRVMKRRPKKFPWLKIPRHTAKARILEGLMR
jgi:IS4 transposase